MPQRDTISFVVETPEPVAPGGVIAVIDLGSSAARLIIAEIHGPGAWRTLEAADAPVALGRDVFVTGAISRDTIRACVRAFSGFRELMTAYQVKTVRAIGTSALREARNRETFIDRIRLRTGIVLEVVEGIVANYLTYMAVAHCLRQLAPPLDAGNALIIEVGGGSTEVMVLDHGRMQAAHTLRLGTVRLKQQLPRGVARALSPQMMLLQEARRTLDLLVAEHPLDQISQFIAVGGDARAAAGRVGTWTGTQYATVGKREFNEFVNRVGGFTVAQIVRRLQLSYDDAECVLPALQVYRLFLEATAAQALIVPSASIRDGLLLVASQGSGSALQEELARQTVSAATSLGRRYQFDEAHARQVTTLALRLFDVLRQEHGYGAPQRALLEVASLLHDVGTFVGPSGHHRHGQYVVVNSDIFGLNHDELSVVGNIIRYHRREKPQPGHETFAALSHEQRMMVLKLAAILRVADALDRGHTQRIQDCELDLSDEELVIRCRGAGELTLEQVSLGTKASLFEDVYGLRPVLLQAE